VDSSGNVFVLVGHDIVRLSPEGNRTLVARYPQPSESYLPLRIAVDAQGRLYVLLTSSQRVRVDRITLADGATQTVYSTENSGNVREFAVDADGTLAIVLISPQDDSAGHIALIPPSAQPARGSSTGVSFLPVQMNDRGGMAFDRSGNLILSDAKFPPLPIPSSRFGFYASDLRVRSIAPDRSMTTILNDFPGDYDPARQSPFPYGYGVAVGPGGEVYLAESAKHALFRISFSGQSTLIAGNLCEAGTAD